MMCLITLFLRDLAAFISEECQKQYQPIPVIEKAEYYPVPGTIPDFLYSSDELTVYKL
jgi:hypothetical protein